MRSGLLQKQLRLSRDPKHYKLYQVRTAFGNLGHCFGAMNCSDWGCTRAAHSKQL